MIRHLVGGVVWDYSLELAAAQIEILHEVVRVLMAGFGAKRSKIPDALAIPRPGPKLPKRVATAEEALAIVTGALTPRR